MKIFPNFTYPHKTQPGQETAGNFPNFFFKKSTRVMFGYPGLDAGLNTPQFDGDIAFPISKIGRSLPSLVYGTSNQGIKLLDKSCFQFNNLFRTMKTCAMNAEGSKLQKSPKSIAICLEMCELTLANFFSSHRNRRGIES